MRKIVLSVALAAATLTAAAPASAQPYRGNASSERQIQREINQLDNQIARAAQRRTVSQREASGLRRDATNLQRLYNRFSRNGLDRRESAQLQNQLSRLQQRLQIERRDRDNRRG